MPFFERMSSSRPGSVSNYSLRQPVTLQPGRTLNVCLHGKLLCYSVCRRLGDYMKQLALAVILTLAVASFGHGSPQQYQTLVDPKPHDCDFDSAPVGEKYCDYETITNAEWEQCGKPQCGLKDVHVSWRKVGIGKLDGRVFAMSEIGTFYPAMKAKGYL